MSYALARAIWPVRYLLCLIIAAGAIAFAPRVSSITIDNDLTAWFSPDDPTYQEYQRLRDEFGGTYVLIVAIRAPSTNALFSERSFAFLEQVTRDIEHVQTVERVDSLATALVVDTLPASAGDDGGIDVRPLIDDVRTKGAWAAGSRAIADDLLRGDLISADGRVTAIIVSFDEDRIPDVLAGAVDTIHGIVDSALPPGFEAFYNGRIEVSQVYNRITTENYYKFTPPIIALTLVSVFWMFRSWRKTALTLVAIAMSVMWTLGLYLLLGLTTNMLVSMIVPLVVVLAIADDVHIMQSFGHAVRGGASPKDAFTSTIAHVTPALFGASATTAVGMLSLTTSDVVSVRMFGVGAAVGVMADFAISIVFVPTLLAWMKQEHTQPPQERWFIEPLRRVSTFSVAHAKLILGVAACLAAIAVAGMTQLRVETNHIAFFTATHPLGQSARVIDQNLGGVYNFEVMLEGEPGSMQQPETLRRIDALARRLEQFPQVRKVTSVANYVRRVNQALEGGNAEAAVIPDSPERIAQGLLVFGLGDEGRLELARVMAPDASVAKIFVKLQAMSSNTLRQYVLDSQQLTGDLADIGVRATVTGSGKLFSDLDHYLVTSQVTSFATALVTIFAVICVVFRSVRHAALAIVPNVFPVLAVFGAMGWLGISLNVATVMVASIALGVVDDDTIHFISRFNRERRNGRSIANAIELATIYEGRAALTTALITSAGLGVLTISEYRPSAWFGGLLALTMAVAFLAEVFILPATIVLLSRCFGGGRNRGVPAGVLVALLLTSPAFAQQATITGHVSALADHLPNVPLPGDPGEAQAMTELRLRAIADAQIGPKPWLRVRLAGVADGMLADRRGSVGDASVDALEAWVELAGERGDIRAGMSRVAWGRLDEVQPTDVINPIDVSRYLLEGRSDARIAVPLVRARFLPSDRFSIEGVLVPVFRPGRFDRLDEDSSPFNLFNDIPPPVCVALAGVVCPGRWAVQREEPDAGELQGGARIGITTGRFDWSVSAWRGFVPFALLSGVVPGATPALRLSHPRYTMVGGDFETVIGKWAIRGETAWFPDRPLPVEEEAAWFTGDTFEAGAGVDRRAGDFILSATILYRRTDRALDAGDVTEPIKDQSARFVTGFTRTFNRDRLETRLFSLVNPGDGAAFVRGLLAWKAADDLAIESSIGWFIGDGDDVMTRFGDRDFGYLGVRYYFGR